jgi:ubiquitin carboxyl-terminal hydrolase 22/27/51
LLSRRRANALAFANFPLSSVSNLRQASPSQSTESLELTSILQRFEHKTTDKTSPQKIDAPVRFPVSLNMAPYTTLVMNLKGKEMEKENERGVVPALS